MRGSAWRWCLSNAALLCIPLTLVACSDDKKQVAATDTTVVTAPTTPTTAVPPVPTTPSAGPSTSATRIPVSTTIAPTPGAVAIDRTLVPEATASYEFEQQTINGVSYANAIRITALAQPQKIEINAGRTRKRFLGSLGIPDDQRSSSVIEVEIRLDGADPVLSTLVKFGEIRDIDIPVDNVLRIRVSVVNKSGDYAPEVAIGNPRFT